MWKYVFLVVITALLFYSAQNTKPEPEKHNESFQDPSQNNATIIPFHLTNTAISQRVITILNSEWGETSGTHYDRDFMSRVFDEFFVMVMDNELVGFIGIDHEYVKPFISHLYVVEKWRRRGYGSQLVAYAESYSRKMSYHTVYLWCKREIVPYYRRKKWVNVHSLIDKMVGKVLMTKTL